jgi:hypothetical protein
MVTIELSAKSSSSRGHFKCTLLQLEADILQKLKNNRVDFSESDVPRLPEKTYRQRAKIETILSVVKRKLSSRAPGRSLTIQIRQALLLGLVCNLYRLRHPLPPQDVNRANPIPNPRLPKKNAPTTNHRRKRALPNSFL